MTELLLMDCQVLPDPKEVPDCEWGLPPLRREKMVRFRFAEDRKRSLGAGLLLRDALIERGLDPMLVETEEGGRPFVRSNPPLFFSLSHSGRYALLAVSDRPVGCDIEQSGRNNEGIARRFYSEGEQAYLRASGDADTAFFRIWTGRESYSKMTGEGLGLDFARYELRASARAASEGTPEGCGMRMPADMKLAEPWRPFRVFRDGKKEDCLIWQSSTVDRYAISVCIQGCG